MRYNLFSLYFMLVVVAILMALGFFMNSCNTAYSQSWQSGNLYVSDTMLYKNHSYIIVKERFNTTFQVLHSPDCQCRFNRKFIVVKHE